MLTNDSSSDDMFELDVFAPGDGITVALPGNEPEPGVTVELPGKIVELGTAVGFCVDVGTVVGPGLPELFPVQPSVSIDKHVIRITRIARVFPFINSPH
jgi:hypothetical protein